MLNKQALAALAAYLTTLPLAHAGVAGMKPPLGVCKEGTCSDDEDGCPAQITSTGDGFPSCKVYNTEDVLNVGEFEAAEGGGTEVFLDIFEPDKGCAVVVRSPASTDEIGCGYIVGSFRNAVCTAIALQETFIVQHCCGSSECEDAGAGAKMIRGLDYKRDVPTNGPQVKKKDGTIVQPVQLGEPPAKRAVAEGRDVPTNNQEVRKKDGTIVQPAQVGEPAKSAVPETGVRKPKKLLRRDGLHDDCSDYVQEKPVDDEYYTRPDDSTQIVATGVDGGTTGGKITITKERTVSQSNTMSAGLNIDILSIGAEFTYEESITDGKDREYTIPAGQKGKVGFTPNLKCKKGKMQCGDKESEGEMCTGYREGGEIAGTYAVIATS